MRTQKDALLLLALALSISTVLARTNFTQCNHTLATSGKQHLWTGKLRGLLALDDAKHARLYTFEACVSECGGGYEPYPWRKIAETITTWVLPAVGLLLQAPYESNAAVRKSLYLTVRWLGSPVASLTCTLWNIKVTGRCALLVDMATKYHISEALKAPDAVLAQIRDSFYLLGVLNQYTFLEGSYSENDLERLLRFALFDPNEATVGMRRRLAATTRRQRRRGVVQVMVTLFWFVVVLVISVHRAFGDLGDNATAHDLALGLLMGWLPVLIASTVVDRNPTDTTYTRRKLNAFLSEVQRSNPSHFKHAIEPMREDLFGQFSGQGRLRWHYGAAHGILNSLEDDFLHARSRNWHTLYTQGRLATLRLNGPTSPEIFRGLLDFDIRQAWQAGFSWLLLVASCFGAYWISYNTPTVGLGCRSGGYMIFGILATAVFMVELAIWPVVKRIPLKVRHFLDLSLTLVETINTGWLAYIVFAQTFGIYNSCACKASQWGGGGGYIDFESIQFYKAFGIGEFWMTGTIVGMVSIGVGCGYMLEQWMTQSFLWSTDHEKAMRGLQRTRWFKMHTIWTRVMWRKAMTVTRWLGAGEGRSVRWVK